VITLSCVAGGKCGYAPRGAGRGAHQHTLFRHFKNSFFSKIWTKICLKTRIFL